MNDTSIVTRQARLFRAGDYSDKNAQITVADLDAIVATFEATGGVVPLRVEHTETVLDPLGTVTNVYRRGAELLGAVNLPVSIAAHLAAQDAPVHFSVNLSRSDEGGAYRLVEVSLVREGRVDGTGFVDDEPPTPAPTGDTDAVSAVFARFRREGRLSPAMETPLRELVTRGTNGARFAADGVPALDALTRLLTALPVSRTMTGMATGETVVLPSPLWDAPEAAPSVLASVCERLGVSVADAARHF
ncbi:MAG: hypothetical protein H7Y38_08885 [Armatimonadetes bacterium]|nr:hypothetical protein [Armatimonadota bacterium]